MKNHVVSLELAKQLKEAGYPQESEFGWFHTLYSEEKTQPEESIVAKNDKYTKMSIDFICAAPLATELLEYLPEVIDEKLAFGIDRYNGMYCVGYGELDDKNYHNSLPDALAEYWIYLKNNNLL